MQMVKKARQAGALFGGRRQAVERTTPRVPVLFDRKIGRKEERKGNEKGETPFFWFNGESKA
jgi:hypothetical protein